MFILVILIVVCVFLANTHNKDMFLSIIMGGCAGFVIFILFSIVMTQILFYCGYGEYEVIESHPIASLNVNSEITGTFILGTGTVRKTPHYYFYREEMTPMGVSYVRDMTSVDSTFIIETNEQHPHHQTQTIRFDPLLEWGVFTPISSARHYIIVPEGTIIREFELR
jgi:hypothetical protein